MHGIRHSTDVCFNSEVPLAHKCPMEALLRHSPRKKTNIPLLLFIKLSVLLIVTKGSLSSACRVIYKMSMEIIHD